MSYIFLSGSVGFLAGTVFMNLVGVRSWKKAANAWQSAANKWREAYEECRK